MRVLTDYVTLAFFVSKSGDILFCNSSTLSLLIRHQFSPSVDNRLCSVSKDLSQMALAAEEKAVSSAI